MVQTLACPSCSAAQLDVRSSDSIMALKADLALFSLRCPTCGTRISSIQPIPESLRAELHAAAVEVGALGYLNAE